MSKYDKRKKQLQDLIEKEASYLRSTLGKEIWSALKYNYYKLKLFFMELYREQAIKHNT